MTTRNFNVKNGLTAGNITLDTATGNANVSVLNSAGRVVATDNMIVTSSGGEGGQIILSFVGISGITGQANSTWNMDVDSSNNFRLFYQNATGTTGVVLSANATSNLITTIGNVSAPYFIGNGSQLTGITVAAGSSIVNGTSNVVVDASANVRTSVAGTPNVLVVTSTGANVTGTANISGNLSAGNIQAGVGSGGNITGANLITANFFAGNAVTIAGATSGIVNVAATLGNLGFRTEAATYTDAAATGTQANAAIHYIAQPTIGGGTNAKTYTNMATLFVANAPAATTNATITNSYAMFVAAGNSFFGGNILGTLANGNSNVSIPTANGNINLTAVGNSTLVVTGTGANVTGYANISGNITTRGTTTFTAVAAPTADMVTITNAGQPVVTAGVSGLQVTYVAGNAAIESSAARFDISPGGNASATWNGLRVVATGAAVAGESLNAVKVDNKTAGAGTSSIIYAGTGYDNILNYNGTSVIYGNGIINGGQLGNLATANNVVIGNGTSTATSVAPGTNGNVLTSNGTNWVSTAPAGASSSIVNGTSNVNIPASGGNVNTSVGGTANVLVVTATGANVTGTLNVTGNATVGNLTTGAGTGGNISGANVISANSLILTTSANIPIVQNGNSNVSIVANANINFGVTGAANVASITAAGIITTVANAAITSNSHTASGAATGNANVVGTVTGNLGIRAISSTYTDNSAAASATIANTAVHGIGIPTLAAANTGVISTNAATFFIEGPPTAGTNMTITNGYALHVEAGNALFAGNILGTLANGNSNVRIATANGNVTLTAVGNTTMTITGTGANITGTANVSGNANVGNIGAATGVFTTAANTGLVQNGTSNVTIASGANVSIFTAGNATAQFVVTSTGANIPGTANVVGNANVGNIGAATAILTTAANVPLVQNGTSNIAITSGANVTIGVASTARITATSTGANVNGTLGVSGILTGSANVSGTNVISSAYQVSSVNAAVSAAGTTQGTGTVLATQFNVVSTVVAGAGVVLPVAVAGLRITVLNTSANALLVYPAASAAINSAAINIAYSQPAGARLDYISTSTTQWYTLNATYG